MIPLGGTLEQPTLDLCEFDFRPTEAKRVNRLQLRLVKGSRKVSNEIVIYAAGGAELAFTEMRQAVATCSAEPVASFKPGMSETRTKVAPLPFDGLLPGSVALLVGMEATRDDGTSVGYVSVAVYQHQGDVLSTVYVPATTEAEVPVAKELAAKAAKVVAQRLTQQVG